MINGHGNDIHLYAGQIVADFSSNVVPYGMHSLLADYLCTQIKIARNYPEPDAASLSKKLANFYGITEESVVITNGSAEAFYLVAHLFSSCSSTIVIPSFAEYEDASRIHNHKQVFINNAIFEKQTNFDTDLVWLGNPNNPDGKFFDADHIENLCKLNPNTYIVVDEAYTGLCSADCSSITKISNNNNLILIRSLTKIFAIPGLRLGYIVANPTICEKIRSLKMPWSVNSLAIAAGSFIIDNYNLLVPNIEELLQLSRNLQQQLKTVEGIDVVNSQTNYFLVKLHKGKSSDLKAFLINEYGLLVRDASNFRGLNTSFVRIAAQQESYNTMLVEGIKQWITTQL
jgi:threonine-phosphate decarboxylase